MGMGHTGSHYPSLKRKMTKKFVTGLTRVDAHLDLHVAMTINVPFVTKLAIPQITAERRKRKEKRARKN